MKLKDLADMKHEATGGAPLKGAAGGGAGAPEPGQALKDFIMSLVAMVRMEVEERRKQLDATDEQLAEMVLARLATEQPARSGEQPARPDDMGSRKRYGAITREVVWDYVNAVEAERIISRLKSGDQLFAQKFFYGKDNNGCNISRLRSKIVAQIKQAYRCDVSVEEFGNIVYAHLWDNGTWGVLDSYARKSSFFCWLEQVARHEVTRVLEDMKVVNARRERTVGNTRLLGASVAPDVWDFVISDLMPEGLHKDLLMAAYAGRKDERKMMAAFRMDAVALRAEMKKAEAMLKDKLIRGDSYYEELVLRDKAPRSIEVSEEFVKAFVKWQEEKSDVSPLADVLGVNLGKEEVCERVVDFLYRFSDTLNWSDEDKLIWRLRFIENTSPVEVAERCGKARAWLDTRYSRLNKKFNIAIREWWKSNS